MANNAVHYLTAIKARLESLYEISEEDSRLREHLSDEVDWIDAELERLANIPAQGSVASEGLLFLASELEAFHDCADGDFDAGNGHFRLICVSGAEQQRLNLRAALRDAAKALRIVAAQQPAPGEFKIRVGAKGSGPWDRTTIERGDNVVATVNTYWSEGPALAEQLVAQANKFASAGLSRSLRCLRCGTVDAFGPALEDK